MKLHLNRASTSQAVYHPYTTRAVATSKFTSAIQTITALDESTTTWVSSRRHKLEVFHPVQVVNAYRLIRQTTRSTLTKCTKYSKERSQKTMVRTLDLNAEMASVWRQTIGLNQTTKSRHICESYTFSAAHRTNQSH